MKKIELLANLLKKQDIAVLFNEPLSLHSTFKIGGAAQLAVFPDTLDKLKLTVDSAQSVGVKYTVVGNGSNILFADSGYDGMVVFTSKCNNTAADGNIISAECGVSFTKLAMIARDAGLSGLEFAYGIPGTVGGAVYMNAGAYGGEVSQTLRECCALDEATGVTHQYDNSSCGFGYRTSAFSRNGMLTVLSASFELTAADKIEISAKMDDFMSHRREKQPLELPSAGSTFKRPEGFFAGKLIEDSGLKGYSIGGAQVSEKHAGFIVNKGNATAADVLRLIAYIRETVFRNFNVELECEIKYID